MIYYSLMKTPNSYIKTIRYAVQGVFLLLTLFIGYRFYEFVMQFTTPGHPLVQRPPSVEAFLPIAGLMSFKFFLFTGIVEPAHPAAFIMFVAAVTTSLVMKKGFCGWICPIGTVSQYFWMAGERIFGRNFRMGKFTDAAVRSLKYILMSLFLLFIGVAMAPNMMVLFFISDYYKVADVRTMQFFTNMSVVTFWVLIGIGGMSLFYKNFWCRYLCPYGALLGLASRFGPVKIRRSEKACTHCRACSESCPSLLDVEKQEVVSSPECFGCMTCVSSCPAQGALDITAGAGRGRRVFQPSLYPVVLIVIFYLIIGLGMATGTWHSQVPLEEYSRIIPGLIK
ncbi:MAG TPA: 4Fe-4S binding protein [Syntrophales bacterium]|nr:4Fe-4S binding protein [Syntrophales bacterium]